MMNSMWKIASGLCLSNFRSLGKHIVFGGLRQCEKISAPTKMWYMCSLNATVDNKLLKPKPVVEYCRCGCSGALHTKGEKDLINFLKEEIVEEQKAKRMPSLPRELSGFVIETDGAELKFEKKNNFESIIISMNVNHSVDTEENGPEDGYMEDMKSKPNFEVDITRNNHTLNFACSYTSYADSEGKGDVYQIDEVSMFKGEWNENKYSVAGDILDENLYDLFMSILFEKGITNEFMNKVCDIATFYEHSQYVDLLEGVQKFFSSD